MADAAKKVLLAAGHEEKFRVLDSSVEVLKTDGEEAGKPRRFKAVAYTGKDVGRYWGRMVINTAGLKRDERMGMLLEHYDTAPVAVCESHEIDKKTGKLTLEGYFLSAKASEHAPKVIARADEGWPWKMSVGVRFLKHHEIEEGAEEEVNGRTFSGPMVVIDEAQLFETSFIHVSPADWDTEAEVMRAAQERTKMAEPIAPGTTPVETREQILAEGRRLEREERSKRRAELKAAFPGRDLRDFRARMFREGKSIAEAKAILADELLAEKQARRARLAAKKAEKKAKAEADGALAERFQHAKPGVTVAALQEVDPGMAILKLEDRARLEVERSPLYVEVFEDNAIKAVLGSLKTRFNVPELRRRSVVMTAALEAMAADLVRQAREKGGRFELDAKGNLTVRGERLGVGKGGPDFGRVVVKGFIGSFYQSYEEEYVSAWAQRLSFQIDSNQEAEIIRWLGAPPQLEEWKGPRIAKDIPIYQQLLQNVLYVATLNVDVFDWKHQKFGLISRAFGEQGAVASQHWDEIFSLNLIEANPTAYDGVSYFSKNHTLGGRSGTMSNDLDSTDAGFGVLAVADPDRPTQLEAANILLTCVPKLRTFKWANGLPINGKARKFAVMVPSVNPAYEGAFLAAVRNERLDLGATNPLYATGHNFEVIPNPYLTGTRDIYIFRLDTTRSPFVRAEPDPIEMQWQGPGSHTEFEQNKYAMGIKTTRGIAPGAWESSLRLTVGA